MRTGEVVRRRENEGEGGEEKIVNELTMERKGRTE